MVRLLITWVLQALAVFVVSRIVPGFHVSGFGAALWAALAIAIANSSVGWLLKLLSFPLAILTLGLVWIVVNALMLLLAAVFVPGFRIDGFVPAFFGAIALSIVNFVLSFLKSS